jgi:hypothetical protein
MDQNHRRRLARGRGELATADGEQAEEATLHLARGRGELGREAREKTPVRRKV